MSDFENIVQADGIFTAIDESSETDFFDIGDEGVIIITTQTGFGEGGFGEGPFGGGEVTVIVNGGTTIWTEINTP